MSDDNIHALPVGHEFDGYRILRVLGAGGFGITYLAEEIQIGRKVAIKEYLPSGFAARAADSSKVRAISAASKERFDWGLDRFRQEAKTLVAFEHPNIIAVHRYFEDNGTAYLVMQYVEGKPLDALLAKANTLAESEIDEVIGPILDGLEDVHAAHFLHRDIKPANIYIRKDGRPVLLDFGAARQAFGGEVKSITAIVSEGYAPFEQYEARGDQGPWTDVYALGAVLYRCITGGRPPAAPERISARVRGAPDPMAPAKTFAGGQYSAKLLAATDRALGVTREERPQNVGELRELLRGAGATPSRRVASVGRREGMGETGQPTAAPPPPPASIGVNPRRKSGSRGVALAAGIAVLVAIGGTAYFALTSGKPAAPGAASVPSTPPQDTAAQADVAEIAAGIERAKAASAKGELERGRDELKTARRRAEEALARRPGNAELQRALDGVVAAETELASRIAARVKELIAYAEREAGRGDFDEVQRYVDQISRLDLATGARERHRFDEARRLAEAERVRAEKERARVDEARRQEGTRRQEAEARAKFAGQRLDQARAAFERDRLAEARRLADDAESLAKQAAAAAPGSLAAEAAQRDIEAFRRDLIKRIGERVAALVREARELIRAGKIDDAEKRLDEAAELEPASAEIGPLRREAEAARKRGDEAEAARKRGDEARSKSDEERRRRDDAERRKKEEEAKKKPGADKPETPAAPGALNLAGRTGTLSRISSERRAVMRIQLQFGAGGALAATCTTESAEGGQSPCFGQASGGGRWSLNGATLCVSSPVLDLPGNTCFQVSGSGNQLTLSGPGFLAGAMFLR